MKTTHLEETAQLIVDTSCTSYIDYNTLNEYQRDRLTAAAIIKDSASTSAHDAVTQSDYTDDLIILLIDFLNTNPSQIIKRTLLLMKMGDFLVKGARKFQKSDVENALEKANAHLALIRQFYS